MCQCVCTRRGDRCEGNTHSGTLLSDSKTNGGDRCTHSFCLQNSECGRERCVRVKVEAVEKERKRWRETRGRRDSQKEKNVSSRGGEHIEAVSSTCKLCVNTAEGLYANRAVTLAFRDVPHPLAPPNRLIRQTQAFFVFLSEALGILVHYYYHCYYYYCHYFFFFFFFFKLINFSHSWGILQPCLWNQKWIF